jgi:hypothetical protein
MNSNLLVASDGQSKISNWIGIIYKSKLRMTLLLPQQNDNDFLLEDVFVLAAHVILMKIKFNALLEFPLKFSIATVFLSNFVRVTHISTSNFTLLHVFVIDTDMMLTPSLAVRNQEFNWWSLGRRSWFISISLHETCEGHHHKNHTTYSYFPTVITITVSLILLSVVLRFQKGRLLLSKKSVIMGLFIGYAMNWVRFM